MKHNTNQKGQRLTMTSQAHPPEVVDSRPWDRARHYQISLTKVVGMMWMQRCTEFSLHVAYHSMFFAHPIGMKW